MFRNPIKLRINIDCKIKNMQSICGGDEWTIADEFSMHKLKVQPCINRRIVDLEAVWNRLRASYGGG